MVKGFPKILPFRLDYILKQNQFQLKRFNNKKTKTVTSHRLSGPFKKPTGNTPVGLSDYYQFWSVRQSKRTQGTITCANHFNGWASFGMDMGNLYEVSFAVEGQGNGTADVYYILMNPDPPPPGNIGDVDRDGFISIVDALLIAQYYVNLNPEGFDQNKADVDCDGSITIVDALIVA